MTAPHTAPHTAPSNAPSRRLAARLAACPGARLDGSIADPASGDLAEVWRHAPLPVETAR